MFNFWNMYIYFFPNTLFLWITNVNADLLPAKLTFPCLSVFFFFVRFCMKERNSFVESWTHKIHWVLFCARDCKAYCASHGTNAILISLRFQLESGNCAN